MKTYQLFSAKFTKKTSVLRPLCRWLTIFAVVLSLSDSISSLHPLFAATSPSPTPTISPKPSPTPRSSSVSKVSPSPSPSPDSQATENLKDRIDRILEQRQGKLRELEAAGQHRRIFIGEVQRITEQTITLHNRAGNQSFTIDSGVILVKNNKPATLDDIAIGDWLGVIGFLDKETIQPQLVIISNANLLPTNFETTIGTIKQIDKTQVIVTDPNQIDHTYSIARQTQFQDNQGNSMKRESLQTQIQVLIIAEAEVENKPAVLIKSLAEQR